MGQPNAPTCVRADNCYTCFYDMWGTLKMYRRKGKIARVCGAWTWTLESTTAPHPPTTNTVDGKQVTGSTARK